MRRVMLGVLPAITLVLVSAPIAMEAQEDERWRLVPDVRIGGEVEYPGYYLEAVRYIVTGPDGRIYAADPRALQVLVFSSNGEHLGAFGGRGQGPGEFQAISGLGWRGDELDELWVADRLQSRITVFTAEGEVVATRSFRPEPVRGTERPARIEGLLTDGSVLTLAEAPPHEPGSEFPQRMPVYRHPPDTSAPEPFTHLLRQPSTMVWNEASGRVSANLGVPRNDDRWAVAPDGSFVVVVGAERSSRGIDGFRFEVVGADGQRRLERRFDHAPFPVTDEERDRILANFANRLASRGTMTRAAAVRRGRELLPLDETRIVVDYLLVGSDGRIWFHRRDRPGTLTAVDPDTGEELGIAVMPDETYPGIGVDAANSESIWMAERDSFGIAYLVRYRLELEMEDDGGS